MSFTSYASDFHDVTLWRALGQITAGSYIDAVSDKPGDAQLGRAFRELGWHGIHFADDMSREHAAPRVILDALFDSCQPGPVHWLHLDANDLAKGVLATWQRSAIRPWIIVVSNARTEPAVWQPDLVTKGYTLAGRTEDTLFYTLQNPSTPGVHLTYLPQRAARSGALQLALQAVEQRLLAAEHHAAIADQRAETFQHEAAAALAAAGHAQAVQVQLQGHLQAVFASTSWRVTRPLRWVSRLIRSPGAATRELVTHFAGRGSGKPSVLLRRTVRATLAQPAVRRIALRLAARYPALARRVLSHLHDSAALAPRPITSVPAPSNPTSVLGPRFRTLILDDLAHVAEAMTKQGRV